MSGIAKLKTYLLLAAFSLMMVSSAMPRTIYVDGDAVGADNGSSWTDAFNYLQDALTDANSASKPVEIRVAQGTYRPDENTLHPDGTGDRTATFQLINDVTIKGGYAGTDTPDPNSRDIELYETILSGDLNSDDGSSFENYDENSYHVVTGSEINAIAVLYGFTIIAGNASGTRCGGGMYSRDGCPSVIKCTFRRNRGHYGGGIYSRSGRLTLADCTLIGNSAEFFGGGLYCQDLSNPILADCKFIQNSTGWSGGGMSDCNSSPILTDCVFIRNSARWGGAIDSVSSIPKLLNCTFSGNSAENSGGGMYNYCSKTNVTNCMFNGNLAGSGGGMDNTASSIALTNCIFSGNSAMNKGGGVYNQGGAFTPGYPVEGGNLTLTNCTFADNSAADGNAIVCDSSNHAFPSELQIINCILWDGGDEIWNSDGSAIAITYSNVQGGWVGEGNIDTEPCFVQPGYREPIPPPPPPPPLLKASNPDPTNDALGVSTTADLSWTAGTGATSHDVYFGTEEPPPFIDNQTSTKFDPGTMMFGTTYYWRIDEVNDLNTTIGDMWNFTTIMAPPPPPILTMSASYMSDNLQYIWIDGDYRLLLGSPCIDAGDPNYVAEPDATDLDGRPRVINGRIDMGAYEYGPPVSAEVRIIPRTINLASKGKWINAFLWLPKDYNIIDIDADSVLLESEIQAETLSIDEQKQVAIVRFSREEVRDILTIGEVGLTITGRLTDGTVFEAKDVIIVIDKGSRKSAKQEKTE